MRREAGFARAPYRAGMAVNPAANPAAGRAVPKLVAGQRRLPAHVSVYAFVIVPFVALVAAVPVAWGWGLG